VNFAVGSTACWVVVSLKASRTLAPDGRHREPGPDRPVSRTQRQSFQCGDADPAGALASVQLHALAVISPAGAYRCARRQQRMLTWAAIPR